MNPRARRWITWAVVALVTVGVLRLTRRFPWSDAVQATLDADAMLVSIALAINLISLVAKGWAWELIINPVQRVGWRVSQAATLAGAAVTNLSNSVVGEAARMQLLVKRTGISWRHAFASVVYLRVVEGLAFAIFLVAAPLMFPLPPALRVAPALAAVALLVALFLLVRRPKGRLAGFLPRPVQNAVTAFAELVSARALPGPLALALVNWAAQWATYGLVLRASGISPAWQAAFVALLATNVAALVPISPGNVGVFQAAMVLGLLPIGGNPTQALVAGIVLQAIQIPPVLVLAAAVFGLNGLKQLRTAKAPAEGSVEPEAVARL